MKQAVQHVGYITVRADLSFVTHTKQQCAGGSGLIKLKLLVVHTANKDLNILCMISILIAALINPGLFWKANKIIVEAFKSIYLEKLAYVYLW